MGTPIIDEKGLELKFCYLPPDSNNVVGGNGKVLTKYNKLNDSYITEVTLKGGASPYYSCLRNKRLNCPHMGVTYLEDKKHLSFLYFLIPYKRVAVDFNVLFAVDVNLYAMPVEVMFSEQLGAKVITINEIDKRLFVPFDLMEDYRIREEITEAASQKLAYMNVPF